MTLVNTEALEDFLRETIGLAADALGRGAVGRAAQRRMTDAGCHNLEEYVRRLRADERLRQQLIEELVVPETWFFRDRQPFLLLARLAAAKNTPLRLLSLPCATGEEPYSLAMTLLAAGLAPEGFCIDAVDISQAALAAAQRASYGLNSFRGDTDDARRVWFQPKENRWQLDPRVCAQVAFRHGNLFDYAPGVRYDYVFCRNLLIYFDAPAQGMACRRLLELLADDGVLFVGHAESAVMLREGLAPLREDRAFAFMRKAAAPAKVPPKPAQPVAGGLPRPVPARAPFADVTRRAPVFAAKAPASSLESLKALADRGRLVEAAAQVRAFVTEHGPSAEIFNLLAIIEDARGDKAAAEAAYRKVLYLEPRHQEAMTHLALLLERRGDPEAARLRRRVQRSVRGGDDA